MMLLMPVRGLPSVTVRTSLQTDATSRHRGMVWLWQRQRLRKQRQTCKRDMLISAGRYCNEDHFGLVSSTSLATCTERERAVLALLAQEDMLLVPMGACLGLLVRVTVLMLLETERDLPV